jgi:hypothetical protein
MIAAINAWLERPATNMDVIIIALIVAWLLCMLGCSGAASEAKRHANDLFRRR